MRHSLKGIFVVSLSAALAAGCATVQVSQPTVKAEAPADTSVRNAHWQFDADSRPPAERDGYRPPQTLAVLLPLTGSLAAPAASVRDGLLAGYYGEQRRRPEIRFYDTAGTTGGAVAAYAKAVAEGADQVLGPLARDGVDAIFRLAQPAVPVIARISALPSQPGHIGSLPPEAGDM